MEKQLRHNREYLRDRRVRDISNGDVLAHTRQPGELTISNLITSVFERKAYIYQILVKEELERVGKNLAEEEKRLDGVDNGLTAYIPSLGQLCMRLVPKNVTARSLTAHYENLNLDLRKDDASDDSLKEKIVLSIV